MATLDEATTDTAHLVNPADLATRILALRWVTNWHAWLGIRGELLCSKIVSELCAALRRVDMAKRIMKNFGDDVARDNIELMRRHLEASSYVSGSYRESRKARDK